MPICLKRSLLVLPIVVVTGCGSGNGGGNNSDTNRPIGAVTDNNAAPNTIPNNAEAGDFVGITALAVDPDDNDTVTYRLINSAQERFTINVNSGRVTVNDSSLLDIDDYMIKIRATSSDNTFSEIELPIVVTDGGNQAEPISQFFPPSGFYEGDNIDIYGQLNNANTANSVVINVGTVNVQATINNDGGWRAVDVPLGTPGEKMITVTLNDTNLGDITITSPLTVVDPLLTQITDMEPYGEDEILLLDHDRRAIIAMNIQTKAKRIISGRNHGEGNVFSSAQAFAVDNDNNVAYVVDLTSSSIVLVDLNNGNRNTIFDRASGFTLSQTKGIVLDKSNERLIVHHIQNERSMFYTIPATGGIVEPLPLGNEANPGIEIGNLIDMQRTESFQGNPAILVADTLNGNIIAINISGGENDGERRIISTNTNLDQGPPLHGLTGIFAKFDNDQGTRIYAITSNAGIMEIDADGNRTLKSDNGNDFTGPRFNESRRMVFAGDQYVVLQKSPAEFLTINNIDNGNRELLASAYKRGNGGMLQFFDQAQWLDVFTNTGNVIVSHEDGLTSIDVQSGDIEFLGNPNITQMGLTVDNKNQYIYAAEDQEVSRRDVDAQNLTTVTDNGGAYTGPNIMPTDITLDKNNNRIIIANTDEGLISADLDDGSRTLISRSYSAEDAPARGNGPSFLAMSVIYHSDSETAYALGGNGTADIATLPYALTSIDAAINGSGDREQLLLSNFGSEMVDLALDEKHNRILITDKGSSFLAVRAIDINSKNSSIVSDDNKGQGTPLRNPFGIGIDVHRDRVWVTDRAMQALIAIDPVSGDRVVVSR